MNNSAVLRQGVTTVMLLLLGLYCYLNINKLSHFAEQWDWFSRGKTATIAQIKIDDQVVWQKPLVSTGFYDGEGKKQVHYLTISTELMQEIKQAKNIKSVVIDGDATGPLMLSEQGDLARADIRGRRLYFADAEHFGALAKAAWNENIKGWTNVRCKPASLCNNVKVSSENWFQVEGPYLPTEKNKYRRGLPRGRWLIAPKTTLKVVSDKHQQVDMLINIYGLVPEQQIAVQGRNVSKVVKAKVKQIVFLTEVWELFPHSFIVTMNLQPGENDLMINYSMWKNPVEEGEPSLAAYLSGITIRAAK